MTEPNHLSAMAEQAVPDSMAPLFMMLGQKAQAFNFGGGEFIASTAVGAPDNALLPWKTYLALAEQTIQADPSLLNYRAPQGLEALRSALADMVTDQGVVGCSPDNLLITNGGMEAISFGAMMTVSPGDTILVEGPGYAGALSVFALLGARVVQLPFGEDGVTPDVLEEAIKKHNPRLVSLMPDYQNPTGAIMPLENRQKIGALLQKYHVLALEDGAYSQLAFEGSALPPLQSFAPEHVLYATSVSKIFAPGMRIGGLVAPAAVLEAAAKGKSAINMQASGPNQAVTAMFITSKNGYLEPHLALLRKTFRSRRDAMITALETYFSHDTFTWTRPNGGMFLWLTGPESTDFTALFEKALENGVAYVPGDRFYANTNTAPRNSARLNFASTPEDKIDEAIRRLAITAGVI